MVDEANYCREMKKWEEGPKSKQCNTVPCEADTITATSMNYC
jgi:hypothetical protein